LLEQNEAWEEALEIRREMGDWNRVREIYRQEGDWRGEAEACRALAEHAEGEREAAGWLVKAGELYAQHELWLEALACFEGADYRIRWAEVLAALERYREAAELLADLSEPYPAEAAGYYRRAAQAEMALIPDYSRGRRCPAAAALYIEAARWYEYAGQVEEMRRCRAEADQCERRPRLELVGGQIDRPFQQGAMTTVDLILRNIGYGPASQVRILASGSALRRAEPEPVSRVVKTVAPGTEITIAVALEPQAYSVEGTPLQFDLIVDYQDVFNDHMVRQDGPYEINQPVAYSIEQLAESGPVTIHIHQPGSYFAGQDQVIVRPGGDARTRARAGGDQVIVGETPVQATPEESDSGESSRSCPNCGQPVVASQTFCDGCGWEANGAEGDRGDSEG
jgi:hypothetical protein